MSHRIPAKFFDVLERAAGRRVTVADIATAAQLPRARVQQILGNVPGRGTHTRKHVAAALRRAWPAQCDELFALLGWSGLTVPTGTLHVEQTPYPARGGDARPDLFLTPTSTPNCNSHEHP